MHAPIEQLLTLRDGGPIDAALRAHVSQTGHLDDFEDRMLGWYGQNAVAAGLPEGRLAERFFVVSTA